MTRCSLRSAPSLVPVLLLAVAALSCGEDGLGAVNPEIELEPAELDFGERPVIDPETRELTIFNYGSRPLALLDVRLEGGDGAFSFAFAAGERPASIDPGRDEKLTVTFRAAEKRTYEARLVIESDDDDEPVVEVPLTGIGSTEAIALVEPEALDFGRVGEGVSAVRRVKITSTGSADLRILDIRFKEDSSDAYGFVGSTRTPQTVRRREPGLDDAFVELSVKFSPTAATTGTDGTLVIELTDPARPLVEIPLTAGVNLQPVAEPGDDRQVAPGTRVTFDGSASHDPDGDEPLTFSWKLLDRPPESGAAIAGGDTANPELVPDEPGAYVVELVVTDSAGLASRPRRVTVSAITSDRMLVELVWDHPIADLDLHLRPEGEEFQGPKDCFFAQLRPDWGVQGDQSDDPLHLGDRLSGFGPERVVHENPPDGRYLATVVYKSAQGAAQTSATATVRVFLYGVIQREVKHTFSKPGEVWNAALIGWPNGAVTPNPQVSP